MMSIKLYKAADEVVALLDSYDPDTGEYPPEFENALAVLKDKGQSVVAYILNQEAINTMRKEHVRKIRADIKSHERRMEGLKSYLRHNMARTGIKEIKADDGTFTAQLLPERDASVEIYDERQIPELYLREIPAMHEPDKRLIAQAINDGFDVPGAKIVKKDRLAIK